MRRVPQSFYDLVQRNKKDDLPAPFQTPLYGAQEMKPDAPSCCKCRHLVTEAGALTCRRGKKELTVCDEYKDVSHRKEPIYGGISGVKDWGSK